MTPVACSELWVKMITWYLLHERIFKMLSTNKGSRCGERWWRWYGGGWRQNSPSLPSCTDNILLLYNRPNGASTWASYWDPRPAYLSIQRHDFGVCPYVAFLAHRVPFLKRKRGKQCDQFTCVYTWPCHHVGGFCLIFLKLRNVKVKRKIVRNRYCITTK